MSMRARSLTSTPGFAGLDNLPVRDAGGRAGEVLIRSLDSPLKLLKFMSIVFWNNWKGEKEFRFIDLSWQNNPTPPTTFSISIGLFGVGVVFCWIDK